MSEVCSGEQTFAQLRTGFRDKLVECCFTSTETVGLLGTGAQDGHLDFHTAPELCGDDVVGLNVLGCRLTYIRDKL